jgi:hypothetical protein
MKKRDNTVKSVDVKKILNNTGKVLKNIFLLIKRIVSIAIVKIKEISKTRYGKIDGNYILMGGLLAIVLVVLFVGKLFNNDIVDYPVIYNNRDGDLYLLTNKSKNEDDAIKLSNSERYEEIVYANNSNRYVLFKTAKNCYTQKLLSDNPKNPQPRMTMLTLKRVQEIFPYMEDIEYKIIEGE